MLDIALPVLNKLQKKKNVLQALKKYNLNVVKCTHYDEDQIKGLLNLFSEVIYYGDLLAICMRESGF